MLSGDGFVRIDNKKARRMEGAYPAGDHPRRGRSLCHDQQNPTRREPISKGAAETTEVADRGFLHADVDGGERQLEGT